MHKGKTVVAILVAAGAIGAFATSGFAADAGKLRIQNKSKFFMTYTVQSNDNWYNCNDAPTAGFTVAAVAPGATTDYFEFLRTDGHGCNGKQGQFGMVPSIPTYVAQEQQFSYDSHGAMGLAGSNPNYASQLVDNGNNSYTWIVTPTEK
jgi:hypothetical protein